jgi:EAL domain-containing protein (putative c-di-GMP-specific phosphodiesterase class I)
MNAHVERRMAIERELRSAVTGKLIVPYYQPLVAFEGNRIIGFEALARWKSDKLGWVPPELFITLAEEIGLISELGDQLLRQACIDARTWSQEMTLAFNISGIQLSDPTLGLRILAILAETGFSPRRLELEITETALVDHIAVAQSVIHQLRQAGVRFALDDFGTGYATLSQLLSLQLDRIKIDCSFVDRLGKDKESDTIVRAILGLANGFGLATTAEGIENADQLASLKANGCLEGQGYLFGRAVPANEIASVLEENPRLSLAQTCGDH